MSFSSHFDILLKHIKYKAQTFVKKKNIFEIYLKYLIKIKKNYDNRKHTSSTYKYNLIKT